MPFQFISDHAGFFGSILGAVAGGAGAWAAAVQNLKQLRRNDERQDRILDEHTKELEKIQITRRDLVFTEDCRIEREDCRKILCSKVDALTEMIKESNRQALDNAKGIATIQEHLRGLEKRFEDEMRLRHARYDAAV